MPNIERTVVALVAEPGAASRAEDRIVELDGLRGAATLMVVTSHFFGEAPHGLPGFSCGWVAVRLFFVLSGFLVGRLILERMECENFFRVFYIRRACRTLPVYFFCVALTYAAIRVLGAPAWSGSEGAFPLWSYFTFTQNFFMIQTGRVGAHWLSPTWTLSVEEHFYLIAPAVFFFTPRRWLVPVLATGGLFALLFRAAVFQGGLFSPLAGLTLLPGSADALCFGLIAGILFKTPGIDWEAWIMPLRVAPLIAMVLTSALIMLFGETSGVMQSFGLTFISAGAAAFILGIALRTPESRRFSSPVLRFFGDTSYSVYLTHLAVLGLVHGALLRTPPDIATWPQLAATCTALPVTFLVGWAFTRLVEEPITAYGRSWRWSRAPECGLPSKARAPLKFFPFDRFPLLRKAL
jgi:peptidoglycan/LPS O-acetylase OafA/YrhL